MKYTDPDGRFPDKKNLTKDNFFEDKTYSNPFSFITGIGFYMLGSLIIIGTVAEDAVTGGVGIADDPASFALAASCFTLGYNIMLQDTLSEIAPMQMRLDPKVLDEDDPLPNFEKNRKNGHERSSYDKQKAEIERRLGRKLTPEEEGQWHREIERNKVGNSEEHNPSLDEEELREAANGIGE